MILFGERDTLDYKIRANIIAQKKYAGVHKKCKECGSEKQVELHHPNYTYPEDVRMLCKQCHVKAHKKMKEEKEKKWKEEEGKTWWYGR